MKKLGKIITASAVAVLGYKLIKGTGIVDKVLYNKEYDAAKRYINNHYPNSRFTNLEKTSAGFMCIITTPENKKIILNMAQANEGVYIFSEQEL